MATKQPAKQRFKGSNIRIADAVRRISQYLEAGYKDRFADDSPWFFGRDWYSKARIFAGQLAVKLGALDDLTISKACGIIAALSPQVTWEQNKKLATEFIETGKCNTTGDRLKKCNLIITSMTEDEIYNNVSKKGLKTRAFYMNIRHPKVTHMVTIDRHAIAAAMQLPHSTEALDSSMQKVTDLQYAFFQEAYIEASRRWNANLVMNDTHNIITPQQCQAIVWVTYRKLRNLK